ncbi:MAG: EAL domain-containing protein, partial [Pseudomonadota bacterium]
FQPKVDLASGYICGAEALARWRLPNGRLVSPSVFIELAEETGQISRIGAQIMRKACLEAVQWTQFGQPVSLAVNVSPRQFERAGLDQMVLDALAKSGLPPRLLEIEITESLAIQQPEKVASVVAPLKALGIKLAVDDFGTGHSNLATLTKHAFDVFKVDRQFVSGTPDDAQANAIVEMMLGMGNTLNLQIVGEGIETQEQAEFLAEHGCHIGQGYLYSPPVTGQAFLKMLREQPFVKRPISA